MTAERIVHKTGPAPADLNGLAGYFLDKAGLAVTLRFIDGVEVIRVLHTARDIRALLQGAAP